MSTASYEIICPWTIQSTPPRTFDILFDGINIAMPKAFSVATPRNRWGGLVLSRIPDPPEYEIFNLAEITEIVATYSGFSRKKIASLRIEMQRGETFVVPYANFRIESDLPGFVRFLQSRGFSIKWRSAVVVGTLAGLAVLVLIVAYHIWLDCAPGLYRFPIICELWEKLGY